jgi:hypothetical protein
MLIYIFIIIAVLLLLLFVLRNSKSEQYFDYDWSDKWSDLDKKARVKANCAPIYKIQRKLGALSAWVWVVPQSCEQGLPHTRATDVIAIPENMIKKDLSSVMDHEKVHLLQRLMPWQWARFYRIAWNYEIYAEPPIGMPTNLIKMRRSNPDTSFEPYACWKNRWWSVAVYNSKEDLSLRKAAVKWWDQTTNTIHNNPPDTWTDFFGTLNQEEHPHEISAEYIAATHKPDSEAMAILIKSLRPDSEFPEI